MEIRGEMLIGQQQIIGANGTVCAINPANGEKLSPEFGYATNEQVDLACELASQADDSYRYTSLEQRALFLETIAQEILNIGQALIERAHLETGLPIGRLEGERARTVNQLKLFAKVVRDGDFLTATIDSALPERVPPRPDLRMQKIALGPVAVFGASNFPLAFSVAGGDTAAAFAAGCPVIVKAHNAHPGTSELVGKAIQKAVKTCNLHEGVFSMLIGAGAAVGQHLVSHPVIQAVGFTGSRAGGLALLRTAQARHVPIPVYAEMSSINPVYLLPDSLEKNAESLATDFIDSLTLGAGQFCTNPGLVFLQKSSSTDRFIATAKIAMAKKAAQTMLTPAIAHAFNQGTEKLRQQIALDVLAEGQPSTTPTGYQAQGMISLCTGRDFITNPTLQEEVFGPSSILVICDDLEQILSVTKSLEGQLTATVHATNEDHEIATRLIPVLERKVGRILFNGFPTGVEVCNSMVHGGPYPATSDSRSTSVGATAIDRFLRPVCYQAIPENLLPAALQGKNDWKLNRLVDGVVTTR